MTLPQIIMLNHAASLNSERSKEKAEWDQTQKQILDEKDPVVFRGKRFSEMTSEEYDEYMTNHANRGVTDDKVITF